MINVYWYSSGFAILSLFSMFQIQNCAISGTYLNIFLYTQEQDETVEWNQMTYNGVLKYTEQVFIRDLSISDCRLSRNDTTSC